ncbi:MAG: PD40 domain-containing protein [Sphingobacteriaceae bacterium]|nr:PD40 domain-containing protein [Sphingobacteriaceae bacterium]
MNKQIIYLLIFQLGFQIFVAQTNLPPGQYTSTDKKALKYFEEGRRNYDARQDKKAEEFLKKAIEADPKFMEPHMIIAILCAEQNRLKERIFHLESAIQKAPGMYVQNYFDLGDTEFYVEDYEKAKIHLSQFLKFQRIDPKMKEEAEFNLKCIDFAIHAKKNPKKITFSNMGPSINSPFAEYFPSIVGDESQFYYTRRMESGNQRGHYQEDLFLSYADNKGLWKESNPIRELSSGGNEGAPSISADGKYMFITVSQEMDGLYLGGQAKGFGSCDIFFTQKVNGKWTKPSNLGPKINSGNWESQPSFSSDGKTLYFVRGTPLRSGVVKDIDIYFSVVGEDGKFGEAQKMPDNVNTKKEEQSVFIHPDNQTLYFCSKGHVGMGGADIFMSKKNTDGTWGDPVNLGYPINSSKDENSLLVSPSGALAYFASDRDGGFGELDLYQFEVPNEFKPEKITFAKGKIYNAETKEPLEASFELIDLETGKNVTQSYSGSNGEFLVTLTANKNYIVNVNKAGFLFYSDNFSLKGKITDFSKPYLLDIPLQPIDTGNVVELKNVFFDVNKWDLKPESKAELDKLISFLVANNKVKIELSGHTDSDGDKKANLILSTNRAKAVFDYLVTSNKVQANRLKFKGYGDTKPKVPNTSIENKAKNRRTEFKVIGI